LTLPRANVADSEDAMPVCLKEEGHARDWPPRARQVFGGEIRPGLHEPLVVERDAPTEPCGVRLGADHGQLLFSKHGLMTVELTEIAEF
jgi:hypothetical protein